MPRNAGFTLIELMIVVAIIGLLTAIAVPQYKDYVTKTQLTRAVGELSTYKALYEANAAVGRSVDNNAIGYVLSDLDKNNGALDVASVNADGSGQIQLTLGGNVTPILTDVVVSLERSNTGSWECVIDNSAATVWKDAYLPSGCRL